MKTINKISKKFFQTTLSIAIFILQILFVFNTNANSQTYSWHQLNSPYNFGGFSDVFFINENTGWFTTYYETLYRTTDGGNSWTKLDSVYLGNFSGVDFINENTGFICTYNPAYVLFKTTNGGINLTRVDLPPPVPNGLDAIHSLNGYFIYGCGKYDGFPNFIKSTDGGNTWTTKDMLQYAHTLDDVHFINENTGIITGGIGAEPAYRGSIVLYTSDGGNTWTTKYLGGRNREEGRRICFVNNSDGFISLERHLFNEIYFIKTTDGGLTWIQILLPYTRLWTEGVGFINSNTGWLGVVMGEAIGTTDGGTSWFNANIGINVSNFQMFGDTLGYASGQYIYKYSKTSGVNVVSSEIPENFRLYQNYPNPFNPVTKIRFDIFKTSVVRIKVFDNLGKETAVILNQKNTPGTYEIDFNGSNLSSGIYFYQLETDNFKDVKKMILLR